jgi:hypothetical protein
MCTEENKWGQITIWIISIAVQWHDIVFSYLLIIFSYLWMYNKLSMKQQICYLTVAMSQKHKVMVSQEVKLPLTAPIISKFNWGWRICFWDPSTFLFCSVSPLWTSPYGIWVSSWHEKERDRDRDKDKETYMERKAKIEFTVFF